MGHGVAREKGAREMRFSPQNPAPKKSAYDEGSATAIRIGGEKVSQERNGKGTAVMEPPGETSLRRPTPEEIRERAYEIHLSRNGAPGDEIEDWLQAERELLTASAEKQG